MICVALLFQEFAKQSQTSCVMSGHNTQGMNVSWALKLHKLFECSEAPRDERFAFFMPSRTSHSQNPGSGSLTKDAAGDDTHFSVMTNGFVNAKLRPIYVAIDAQL